MWLKLLHIKQLRIDQSRGDKTAETKGMFWRPPFSQSPRVYIAPDTELFGVLSSI